MSKLLATVLFCLLGLGEAWAVDPESLLSPDDAFQLDAEPIGSDKLLLSWEIADGYYLYRHKIKFVSLTPEVQIGDPIFPTGESKRDQHFGSVEVYRDELVVELPIRHQLAQDAKLELKVTFQGCADIGVCYMPIQKVLTFDLPVNIVTSQGGVSPLGKSWPN